jgi:hypothetical protein
MPQPQYPFRQGPLDIGLVAPRRGSTVQSQINQSFRTEHNSFVEQVALIVEHSYVFALPAAHENNAPLSHASPKETT